jgi:hypothetical protein
MHPVFHTVVAKMSQSPTKTSRLDGLLLVYRMPWGGGEETLPKCSRTYAACHLYIIYNHLAGQLFSSYYYPNSPSEDFQHKLSVISHFLVEYIGTEFSQKLKKLMSYSSYSKTQTHEFKLLRNELSLSCVF